MARSYKKQYDMKITWMNIFFLAWKRACVQTHASFMLHSDLYLSVINKSTIVQNVFLRILHKGNS